MPVNQSQLHQVASDLVRTLMTFIQILFTVIGQAADHMEDDFTFLEEGTLGLDQFTTLSAELAAQRNMIEQLSAQVGSNPTGSTTNTQSQPVPAPVTPPSGNDVSGVPAPGSASSAAPGTPVAALFTNRPAAAAAPAAVPLPDPLQWGAKILDFGKHKGQTYQDTYQEVGYISWLTAREASLGHKVGEFLSYVRARRAAEAAAASPKS